MIGAISINRLAGDDYKRGKEGTWAERFKRYDQQAARDFAMFAWLEARGELPPPNRIDDATVRAWQQAQGAA